MSLSRNQRGLTAIAASIAIIGGSMIQNAPGALTISSLGIGVLLLVVGSLSIGPNWDARTVVLIATAATFGLTAIGAVRFLFVLASIPTVLVMQSLALLVAVIALRKGSDGRVLAQGLAAVVLAVMTLAGVRYAYAEALGHRCVSAPRGRGRRAS